jgi:hypothetical protein
LNEWQNSVGQTNTKTRRKIECFEAKKQGILKGGSITVPLTSCLTGLVLSALQINTKTVSCHTADSKPVKLEVNSTVILPALVFPGKKLLSLHPFKVKPLKRFLRV